MSNTPQNSDKNDLRQFAPNKILHHLDRIKEYLETGDTIPITVEIDPSNVCNHRCLRCTFEDYHGEHQEKLSKEVMIQLADDFAEMGVKAVVWTGGGEPLLNEHMLEVFKYFADKNIEQGLATNGSRVTPDFYETFVKHFTYVRFSVDAASSEMHKQVHGTNDFDKIINSIKELCKLRDKYRENNETNLDIGFSFLTHPENYKEIYDAAKLAKTLGVDYIQIKPVVLHRKSQMDHDYFKSCESYLQTVKDLQTDTFNVLTLDYKFEDLLDKEYNRTYNFCWGNPFLTTISSEGYVNFCCHTRGLKQYTFGNVKEKRFKDIWKSEERKEVIKKMKKDGLGACPPNCKYHMINQTLQNVLSSQKGKHQNFL
jgi:radical SAM protein with 4Fe4S-binding SPASM domain